MPVVSPPPPRRPRRGLALPFLLLLACAGPPAAVREARAAAAASPSAEITSPAELAIQRRLMAPCCWAGTIDNHDSAIAAEMKAEIHRRLAAGENQDAILAGFVDRFGPRVLAEPPARGLNVLVYLLPLLALLGGGALVGLFLRRQIRGGAAPATPGAGPSPPNDAAPEADPYARRVEEALRRGGR